MSNLRDIQDYLVTIDNMIDNINIINDTKVLKKTNFLDVLNDIDNKIDAFSTTLDKHSDMPKLQRNIISEFP